MGRFDGEFRGKSNDDVAQARKKRPFLRKDWGQWTMYGFGGNDILTGGPKSDKIYGGIGNDSLFGKQGNDRLEGNSGNDKLEGGYGDDTLLGGSGNDILDGGFHNDTLYGGAGRDTLRAYRGVDKLYGGTGNDHYYIDTPAQKSQIIEYANQGIDTVHSHMDYTLGANLENLVLETVIAARSLPTENPDEHGGISHGSFAVPITRTGRGNGLNNSIRGLRNSDIFKYRLYGFGGNDRLYGGQNSDVLNGGTGNDSLFGYQGQDRLYGGDGNDYLFAESDDDYLSGGRGRDYLKGGSGTDQLFGGSGNDTLIGYGRGMVGEYDKLTGGSGSDQFVLGDGVGSYYTGAGFATITDFDRRSGMFDYEYDRIQLAGNLSDYRLGTGNRSGSSVLDTIIYKGSDIIGVVQDVTGLSLSSNYFMAA